MTGGGSVFTQDGKRVNHGFEIHCNPDIEPQNLEVNFGGNRFHLTEMTSAFCEDTELDQLPRPAPFDTFTGTGEGRFNGVDGYHIEFVFTDAGEPGKKDTAEIMITDPSNALVLFVSGELRSGNQQAHPENKPAPTIAVDAVVAALLADLDGDGEVGFSDFVELANNFGLPDADGSHGDIDGDGTVGFSDFVQLANNFGRKLQTLLPAAIPADQIDLVAAQLAGSDSDEEEFPLFDF